MQVDVIDTYSGFEKLESNWHAVYQADSQAQLFHSWTWLSPWFRRNSGWLVLAAKPADACEYVAFLPMRVTARVSKTHGVLINELHMAGSFGWADYTGVVCSPDYDSRAIPALAAALRQLNWTYFNLKHLLISDERMKLLMQPFGDDAFAITRRPPTMDASRPDNSRCPYVKIGPDFETYLKEKVSANSRQKFRRLLRQLDSSTDLRITIATAATYERDIDTLISFWKKTWASQKGKDLDDLAARYRRVLLLAAEAGVLFMPALWEGDRPLGVLGNFIDATRKSMLYFVAGRDEAFNNPSPGLLMHAWCIRWAIEHGLTTYDFLRGNEPFKYSFGSVDRRIHNITIGTKSRRNPGDHLDPRCIDEVFAEAARRDDADDIAPAIAGFRQILATHPDHRPALDRQARLLYQQGEYEESLSLCRRLVTLRPENDSDWRQLGKAHLALRQHAEAEAAFRAANRLYPTIAGHHYLAECLTAQNRTAEAAAEMQALLILNPRGSREASQKKTALGRAREAGSVHASGI